MPTRTAEQLVTLTECDFHQLRAGSRFTLLHHLGGLQSRGLPFAFSENEEELWKDVALFLKLGEVCSSMPRVRDGYSLPVICTSSRRKYRSSASSIPDNPRKTKERIYEISRSCHATGAETVPFPAKRRHFHARRLGQRSRA